MHAQKYEDDMQISGPDKVESAKLATEDWKQLGETFKASADEASFVRDATKTYYNAKRSDYVKECRTRNNANSNRECRYGKTR